MGTIKQRPVVAILVGGGPAPGINSVIGAATIRSILGGCDVIGIQDGFKWIMDGQTSKVKRLSIEDISRIHFSGGSCLGTARANPTQKVEHLDACLTSLNALGVTRLITIGGDDTAFSALKLEQRAAGRLQVVHVPKTIDNDLDLPHGIPTFGFQTARHIGVELVKSLMVDAETTSRWYFVVTMGRKAGHLALGIGKAAGATLTVIPEELAVLAEGLVEILDQQDLDGLQDVERDQHGHVRLAEINFGFVLKRAVEKELRSFGIKTTIVEKNIGYELRCADPISFDMEYTRDLGYCAAQFLLEGGNAAMVSIQNGRFIPIPFGDILDPATGRTRVRMVDVESESYVIARRYMIRLAPDDFNQPQALVRLATTAGLAADDFRKRFEYLMGKDL